MDAELLSVNVGRPRLRHFHSGPVRTANGKEPVAGPRRAHMGQIHRELTESGELARRVAWPTALTRGNGMTPPTGMVGCSPGPCPPEWTADVGGVNRDEERSVVEALRTPDDRFRDLPGWDHPPSYVDDLPGYDGLRAHYVDLGPRDAADTYLLLHGEPTWAYLYRKMIPVFLAAGGRVVAPDFFGFGRSDKPVEQSVYTFDFHRDYLLRLVERLDLTGITLVVQDWGGLLGLTLPLDAGFAPRLSRLLAMNTGLAVGTSPGKGFEDWRAYVAAHPDLPVGTLLKRSVPTLSDAEAAAYDAPFPDASYKAGVRAFPQLVMTEPDMPGVDLSRAAERFWSRWDGPSFLAVGARDPVLGVPAMDRLHRTVRGAPPPLVLTDAGHFVQESGDIVARAALAAFDRPAQD